MWANSSVWKRDKKNNRHTCPCAAVCFHPASSSRLQPEEWYSLKLRLCHLAAWPHGHDIHIKRHVWEDFLQILLPLHKWLGILKIVWTAYTQFSNVMNHDRRRWLEEIWLSWAIPRILNKHTVQLHLASVPFWSTYKRKILNLSENIYCMKGCYYVRKRSIIVINQKKKRAHTPASKQVCSKIQKDI